MTVSVGELVSARDADFEKALKWNLRRAEWDAFVEPEVIDRTNEVLAQIIASISTQLAVKGETADPDWKHRARTLLLMVQGRKGEVNRRIKDLNRTEADEVDAWRQFAASLATAIEFGVSGADYLKRVEIPGGDVNAAEWLEGRRARAAAKAVAV